MYCFACMYIVYTGGTIICYMYIYMYVTHTCMYHDLYSFATAKGFAKSTADPDGHADRTHHCVYEHGKSY